MTTLDLGTVIISRRRRVGIRQADLAVLADVSLRTLIAIERGTANPSFETLSKIADVLGMELTLVMKS
ncbi:helix-turn-helix transcriptional regulator [Fibrella aquatilis]|uniref:Helix-turn-helix transcriptional regulator n=1 Tax=Fibrella aquatilis TaxID=2817059 RepID=A0A939K0C8_9BACT|nr:helix-turn-helix transcriptional regulator [Fibrella aquatilis]MBO0934059.1 helix-turn-helix transcriptional regulator [Fibrella aquatilis]